MQPLVKLEFLCFTNYAQLPSGFILIIKFNRCRNVSKNTERERGETFRKRDSRYPRRIDRRARKKFRPAIKYISRFEGGGRASTNIPHVNRDKVIEIYLIDKLCNGRAERVYPNASPGVLTSRRPRFNLAIPGRSRDSAARAFSHLSPGKAKKLTKYLNENAEG